MLLSWDRACSKSPNFQISFFLYTICKVTIILKLSLLNKNIDIEMMHWGSLGWNKLKYNYKVWRNQTREKKMFILIIFIFSSFNEAPLSRGRGYYYFFILNGWLSYTCMSACLSVSSCWFIINVIHLIIWFNIPNVNI